MTQGRLTRRLVLAGSLAGVASLAAPALARPIAPTRGVGGPAFGTWWNLTLPAGVDAEALRLPLEETLERIDRLMSPWRPDSAIAGFNAARHIDWQPIDSEVITVVRAATALRRASAGAFDSAVGPLVGLWGFGPITGEGPPAATELIASDEALRKPHPALTIDLCGIAKGYALDQMVSVLRERGVEAFVIDLGGEIAAHGRHPKGRNWQVAVEDPRPDHDGAAEVLALAERAIATSGDKVNAYTLGSRRYSHIIDPATAAPVQGAPASVSVIADTAMLADGWATALMAAGAGGQALAERNALDVLFLFRDGTGLRRLTVGRFGAHLA